MSSTTITTNLSVKGGTNQLISQPFDVIVDSLDSPVQITVPASSTKTLTIAPSTTVDPSKVAFLLILAGTYPKPGAAPVIKYQLGTDGTGPTISLEYPHIFLGPGAVMLLDTQSNPTSWNFTNNSTADVTVTLHIGRTAVAAVVAPNVLKPAALEGKPAPVDPKAAPVDPKAAPVDPKAGPVDPKAAPVDPKAAPVDPKPAPVNPSH